MKLLYYSVLSYWGAFIYLFVLKSRGAISFKSFHALFSVGFPIYLIGFPVMFLCSFRLRDSSPTLAMVGIFTTVLLALYTVFASFARGAS
jgi:hypothetical protein